VRASDTNSRIIRASLTPGEVSTPEDTSTPGAPAALIARATLPAFVLDWVCVVEGSSGATAVKHSFVAEVSLEPL